jgi:hypothetical protein
MHAVMQYCRGKAKSMTSGRKLKGEVLVVCKILISHAGQESSPPLRSASGLSAMSPSSPPGVVHAPASSRKRLRSKTPSKEFVTVSDGDSPEKKPVQSHDDLRRFWGLPPAAAPAVGRPSTCRVLTRQETISSVDSSEAIGPPEGPDAVAAGGSRYRLVVDSGKQTMAKHFYDGSPPEYAKMIPGKDGFALAVFGTDPPVESEIPNMVIEAVATTKPMKKKKKKAPRWMMTTRATPMPTTMNRRP